MRKSGFTLVELVVVVVIIGILAAILSPVFSRATNYGGRRPVCQSNLKQIGLGTMQYVQDYSGKLPPISVGKQGWADTLQPYLKSQQLFQCPSGEKGYDSKAPFSTDYFLNALVAGLKRSQISSIRQTILLGEGLDNGGTNSHFSELPFDWKTSDLSPAKRHLDGANYAFVDGHVKWLKPERIAAKLSKNDVFTFAIK